jgi:hypothetical protein
MFDANLVGCWQLDNEDAEARDRYGKTVIVFGGNGVLTYEVDVGAGRKQVANLVYRVEADGVLVTDQPSAPSEQRTQYELDAKGRLVLDWRGKKSRYVRIGGASRSSIDDRSRSRGDSDCD